MPSSLITRPLSMGELLDVTFRVYRKHFWKLVLTAGGLLVPIQILSNLFGMAILYKYPYSTGMLGMLEGGVEQMPVWVFGIQIALALVVWFLSLLTGVALMWLSNSLLTGETPGVTESWRAGLGLFLRYLGLLILLAVIGIVVMLGLFILGIIPCLGLFLMVGGFIAIFYLYVRLILAPMAMVADDVGPIDAIKNAWRTSKGRFWRIFAYGLLLWILAFVFYVLPSSAMQFWMIAADVTYQTFAIFSAGMRIVLSIINALWTPLYLLALMALYHELRARYQPGGDIEQRLAALEAEVTPSSSPAPQPEATPAALPVDATPDAGEGNDDGAAEEKPEPEEEAADTPPASEPPAEEKPESGETH